MRSFHPPSAPPDASTNSLQTHASNTITIRRSKRRNGAPSRVIFVPFRRFSRAPRSKKKPHLFVAAPSAESRFTFAPSSPFPHDQRLSVRYSRVLQSHSPSFPFFHPLVFPFFVLHVALSFLPLLFPSPSHPFPSLYFPFFNPL